MKNISKTSIFTLSLFLSLFSAIFISCNRSDDESDDLPQEELSDVLLKITDDNDGTIKTYDYQVNGSSLPNIQLSNGHTYSVEVIFKNGDEDATQEIKDAKDEHFLIYNFPNSDIIMTREDDASTTRTDGNKVGLKTKWVVNTAIKNSSASAQLILTLYHESASVSENSATSGNGTVYGTQTGGETDAQAIYNLIN